MWTDNPSMLLSVHPLWKVILFPVCLLFLPYRAPPERKRAQDNGVTVTVSRICAKCDRSGGFISHMFIPSYGHIPEIYTGWSLGYKRTAVGFWFCMTFDLLLLPFQYVYVSVWHFWSPADQSSWFLSWKTVTAPNSLVSHFTSGRECQGNTGVLKQIPSDPQPSAVNDSDDDILCVCSAMPIEIS